MFIVSYTLNEGLKHENICRLFIARCVSLSTTDILKKCAREQLTINSDVHPSPVNRTGSLHFADRRSHPQITSTDAVVNCSFI